MVKKFLTLGACLTALITPTLGFGYNAPDYKAQIQNNLKTFEQILNNPQAEPEKLMEFLHNTIAKDAKFSMTINVPDAPMKGPASHEIGKAEYINSFLYGPRQIQNYKANIKTKDVQVDRTTGVVIAESVMTEQGTVKKKAGEKIFNEGFTSTTTCRSEYVQGENQGLVIKASDCTTQISTEQSA